MRASIDQDGPVPAPAAECELVYTELAWRLKRGVQEARARGAAASNGWWASVGAERRLSQLAENGAPFTAETFGSLVRVIDALFNPNLPLGGSVMTHELRSQLPLMWQKFPSRLETIKTLSRGTGLFTNFVFSPANASKVRHVIG